MKQGGRRPLLVGLQGADQVQHEIREVAAQARELRDGLLHPVLAEYALAGGERLAHRLGRLGLADRHQRYRAGRPAGGTRSRLDSAANRGKSAPNCL
jgi:hypothetical protein